MQPRYEPTPKRMSGAGVPTKLSQKKKTFTTVCAKSSRKLMPLQKRLEVN